MTCFQACHTRISAPGAQLGLPELQLGVIPGFGGSYSNLLIAKSIIVFSLQLYTSFDHIGGKIFDSYEQSYVIM